MQTNEKLSMTFLITSLCEGGAERGLITLSEHYIQEGHEVTILALAKNNFYTIPVGVKMVYLSNMNDNTSGLWKLLYIPYQAWKLKKYLHKSNIDIVQSHLFRANFVNLISTMIGTRHAVQVVNHSVVSRFLKEGLSGKVNLALIRRLYPKADLIVHISKRMQSDFHRHFFRTRNEKVIYNPYNIEAIIEDSYEPIDDFMFESHKRYIVTVGRLIPLKRFSDVIEAMDKLDSDVELILLGDGSERETLEALVKKYALEERVHFLGQVKNPFKYIRKSNIFVLSSEVEGFPNVIIESMLCETMVISSDCLSGPREILDSSIEIAQQLSDGVELSEFGLLYCVGDVNGLVEAINQVLSDHSLAYIYAQRALERAKQFSVKNIAKEYQEILSYG